MASSAVLNIGLSSASGYPNVRLFKALEYLPRLFNPGWMAAVHNRDASVANDEPTLVVHGLVSRIHYPSDSLFEDEIDRLCRRLDQECIAVYYPYSGHGDLVGPNAYQWGEFDIGRFKGLV
jgi:hypothetical protein